MGSVRFFGGKYSFRFILLFRGTYVKRLSFLPHTRGENGLSGRVLVNSMPLIAESVGYKAKKALQNSRTESKIHSVFDHTFYIEVNENRLINVITTISYMSSTSVLIKNTKMKSFKLLNIKEGMQVTADDSNIVIGNKLAAIRLDGSSTYSKRRVPKKESLESFSVIGLNLRVLRDEIYKCRSRDGLVDVLEKVETAGPLSLFLKPQEISLSERARPYIERLMWGLYLGDSGMVLSNAQSLLGLGPGLTPSCDDFLAGLLMSLNFAGKVLLKDLKKEKQFYKMISNQIYTSAKSKTTIYSLNNLEGACHGEGPDAAVDLIVGLLTKDANQVANCTRIVLKIGETTGADIAIGVYYGIRYLISRLDRIEGYDEIA
jgi:hypothetical protein